MARDDGVGGAVSRPTAGDAREDRAPWSPERRGLTIGLLLAVTTNALAALAVVTIAPRIPADLGGLALYGWLFSAYLLASLLGTVWGGGTADRRGLRLPFGVGLGAFALGLAWAALAPSMVWVVAARVLQGFGGGTATTCVYVAVTRAYADAHRPRLMAYLSTAWVAPALVGPALAGLLAEALGWRAVFAVLAPVLGVVAALTLPRLGAAAGPVADAAAGARVGPAAGASLRTAGLGSASIAVASLGAALAALSWAAERPGAGGGVLGLAAAGAAGGVAAMGLRRLLPPGTLRLRRGLGALVAGRAGFFAAFIGVEAFLALMLTDLHGLSSAATGLVIASGAISWAGGSWWQARSDAAGAGPAGRAGRVRTGVAVLGVGLALQVVVLALAGDALVAVTALSVGGWMAAGFGIGAAHATSSVWAFALAEADGVPAGRVSAALQLADNVGAALATGVGGATLAYATVATGGALRGGVAAAFAVAAAAWGLSAWASARNARPTPPAAARS